MKEKTRSVHLTYRILKDNPELFQEAIKRFLKNQTSGGKPRAPVSVLDYKCKFWMGYKSPADYGTFSIQDKYLTEGIRFECQAHHFAFYMVKKREIKKGKIITHSCQNNWCVEPTHLKENTKVGNAIESLLNRDNIPFNNRTCKIPTSDIILMKYLHYQHGYNATEIKNDFFPDISRTHIDNILCGRHWACVDVTNLLTKQNKGGKKKK